MSENINSKIKNNAIYSYLLPIINIVLFFNKNNPYINHPLVKNHSKTAILLHFKIILFYIIFIHFWIFESNNIFGYWLNFIIYDIILIIIFLFSIMWVYKAYKWEMYKITENLIMKKYVSEISIEINQDTKISEKDKLSIVLSHIPFIGYIIGSKIKSKTIENILKINLFVSIIIFLLLLIWKYNLISLLSLLYIIYCCFIAINLYIKDELLVINLPYYFLPKGKIRLQKNIIKYLKNYIKWDFIEFNKIQKEALEKEELEKKEDENIIKELKDYDKKYLIYLPIINLLLIKKLDTKKRFHIINGLVISFIAILLINLNLFWYINSDLFLFLLFPICFGIWKINDNTYKMPYIYETYLLLKKIASIISFGYSDIKRRKNEVKEVNIKIKD